jgi:hypothetical protein
MCDIKLYIYVHDVQGGRVAAFIKPVVSFVPGFLCPQGRNLQYSIHRTLCGPQVSFDGTLCGSQY